MMNTSGLPDIFWHDMDEAPELRDIEVAVHPVEEVDLSDRKRDYDYVVTLTPRTTGRKGTYVAARAHHDNLGKVQNDVINAVNPAPGAAVTFSGVTADQATVGRLEKLGHSVSPFSPSTPSSHSRGFAEQAVNVVFD